MTRGALAATLAGALVLPAAASALPAIHAHRGAPLRDGVPATPEDTLPAFAEAATVAGVWLEMDAVVTADGVPFVLHDSTLNRTTNCTGVVRQKTAAEIDRCRVDVLGVSDTLVTAPEPVPVPRLSEVLAFAKAAGRPVNVEIKRIPGDPGYVPGDTSFAAAVTDVVKAAGLDRRDVIIQSFDPTNLDVAAQRMPGVQTSFLTLAGLDAVGLIVAAARGYSWISPGGVPDAGLVAAAHGAGIKVVPYTLDTEADVRAAAAAGVDAVITNDLPVAHRALGLAVPQLTTPGTASLAVASRSQRGVLALRGIAVVVRAPTGSVARVRALRGRTVVASGRARVAATGLARVRIPLTRAGRRTLRRSGAARLTVRATISAPGAAPVALRVSRRLR
ncbi:MAG TPA: glycerophosphodiester phosphodiesterase family protein [Solirubrobacteraceae bacterium]